MKKDYKEGVDLVFDQNPELTKIGTERDYSEYIKTIFPESKVKDIVYHGSSNLDIKKFLKPGDKNFKTKSRTGVAGIYFTNIASNAKRFINIGSIFPSKGKIYPVILDLKNPDIGKRKGLFSKQDTEYVKWVHEIKQPEYDKLIAKNKDGVDITVRTKKGIPIRELIALDPSQIHILGSKYDAEKFKEYMKNKNQENLKGNSLENKIISGFFILLFIFGLFFLSTNLTGYAIGVSGKSHNLLGIILMLLGISGYFVYRRLSK